MAVGTWTRRFVREDREWIFFDRRISGRGRGAESLEKRSQNRRKTMLPGGHQHGLSEEVGVPACSPGASTGDGEEEPGARRKWGDPFTADAKEAFSATCTSSANLGQRCPHFLGLLGTVFHPQPHTSPSPERDGSIPLAVRLPILSCSKPQKGLPREWSGNCRQALLFFVGKIQLNHSEFPVSLCRYGNRWQRQLIRGNKRCMSQGTIPG